MTPQVRRKLYVTALAIVAASNISATTEDQRVSRPISSQVIHDTEPPKSPTPHPRSAVVSCSICLLVKGARERAAYEDKMMAKMAEIDVSANNVEVTDRLLAQLRKWVEDERSSFGDFCRIERNYDRELQARGLTLTSEEMFPATGQPESDNRQTTGTGVEGRTWSWDVYGPFSGNVTLAINFGRKANANPPRAWAFVGCIWCVGGGSMFPPGCMEVPWSAE